MKLKTASIVLLPVFCILALTGLVVAQEAVPAPYTGLKNPFAWSDAAAQTAGKAIYRKSCLSCHGSNGNEVNEVDFSAADFPKKLESEPAFYFWGVSEGKGEMTAFKSTISETQRWQALTYIWSLAVAAPETPATGGNVTGNVTKPPPVIIILPTLQLTVPDQAQAGQPLHISALLQDKNGKPMAEAPVVFSINATFLGSKGLAGIGETSTDDKGVATITYAPQLIGNIPIVARYQTEDGKLVTATSSVKLVADFDQFYKTDVGLHHPGFPPDLVLFPESAWQPREPGIAPVTVLRIPGGLPFIPFMSYLIVVILVWSLYIRVMYQVLRIPAAGINEPKARLVPMFGIMVITLLAVVLVLVLITGPYSGPYIH